MPNDRFLRNLCVAFSSKYALKKNEQEYEVIEQLPTWLSGKVTIQTSSTSCLRQLPKQVEASVKAGFLYCTIEYKKSTKRRFYTAVHLLGASITQANETALVTIQPRNGKKIELRFCSNKEATEWTGVLRISSRLPSARTTNFTILKSLGKGHFGEVSLVKHNKYPEYPLALKRVKLDTARKLVNNERIILERINLLNGHHNLTVFPLLLFSFEQENSLHLVTDAFFGGNLVQLLQKRKQLDESTVRYIVSGLVRGLLVLHEEGIAHRDIKLENVLLTSRGKVKLIDFGLAKQFNLLSVPKYLEGRRDSKTVPSAQPLKKFARTFSLVGTAYYQPPEMLNGLGHTLSIDWWQIGCLVYELLIGKPAFLASSYEAIKEFITSSREVSFPKGFANDTVKDLVLSLLAREPTDRLGYDETKITEHKFFKGVNWDSCGTKLDLPPASFLSSLGVGNIMESCSLTDFDDLKQSLTLKKVEESGKKNRSLEISSDNSCFTSIENQTLQYTNPLLLIL